MPFYNEVNHTAVSDCASGDVTQFKQPCGEEELRTTPSVLVSTLPPHTVLLQFTKDTLVPLPFFPRQPCEHVRVIFTACVGPQGSDTYEPSRLAETLKPPAIHCG